MTDEHSTTREIELRELRDRQAVTLDALREVLKRGDVTCGDKAIPSDPLARALLETEVRRLADLALSHGEVASFVEAARDYRLGMLGLKLSAGSHSPHHEMDSKIEEVGRGFEARSIKPSTADVPKDVLLEAMALLELAAAIERSGKGEGRSK
jgi:hypothetical protein